jgi:hypothetical protein
LRSIVVLAVIAAPLVAHAQLAPQDTSVEDRAGARTTEIWAGFSNRSPKLGVLGNRPGMSFALGAARISHRIKTRPGYALDYTLDFIPLALASPPFDFPEAHVPNPSPEECGFRNVGCRFPEGSAHGAGISPLGITAVYRRDRALQFRLGATGGALWFDRKVPTVISSRFNFTATLEAGAQLVNRNGAGVLLVYRFHHLSNAGTAYDNSALASNVISLGARWRRH